MTERGLSGIRVLDFGQYIAGPLAALLLADAGAEVIRVEVPGGPRWANPANAALLRDRLEAVELDLRDAGDRQRARDLMTSADVLIENFRPGVLERLGLGWRVCSEENRRLVYCSVPGFGSGDPRAEAAGWEGIVLAAAGAYAPAKASSVLGGGWWPVEGPVFSPLPLGSVFAAFQAALGVAVALFARARDGLGQYVEVPMFDSFVEALSVRLLSYERNAPRNEMFGTGFYKCAGGGHVVLATLWHKHLDRLCRAVGVTTPTYDELMDIDPSRRESLRLRLVELFAERSAREWEQLGREAGVPIGAVRSMREWMSEPHASESGTVIVRDGVRMPGPAFHATRRTEGQPRLLPPARAPLAGVKVLDLTRVLAGPIAARLLADFGADVLKVDRDPAGTQVSFSEPAAHEFVNRGKGSLVVDLTTEAGREQFTARARGADVLITNFLPEARVRLGIDEASMRQLVNDLIYVHLDTFGVDGPWRGMPGYAEIANAVTGLTERTLGDGPPSGVLPAVDYPRSPFTDPATGILAAFSTVVALCGRARSGGGWTADTSLVRAAMYEQILYVVGESTFEPRPPKDMGWSDSHRLRQVDSDWVFAVSGDDEIIAHPVVSVDEFFALGCTADQLGLRRSLASAEYGTVVQPGLAIRLQRTPGRAGDLPALFLQKADSLP